jgi:hypothetical protein
MAKVQYTETQPLDGEEFRHIASHPEDVPIRVTKRIDGRTVRIRFLADDPYRGILKNEVHQASTFQLL